MFDFTNRISRTRYFFRWRAGRLLILPATAFFAVLCWIVNPWPLTAQTSPLTLTKNVLMNCPGGAVLTLGFQQPSTRNLVGLQFDLHFSSLAFTSSYVDGKPSESKPKILPDAEVLKNYTLDARPVVEDSDADPSTADWRILIFSNQFGSIALLPEGSWATMEFYPSATALNGLQAVNIGQVLATDDLGLQDIPLTGTSGGFLLLGCTSGSKLFLPRIVK